MKAMQEIFELSGNIISLTDMLGKKNKDGAKFLYINPCTQNEVKCVYNDNGKMIVTYNLPHKEFIEVHLGYVTMTPPSILFSPLTLADSKVIRNIIKDVKQQIKRGNLK